MSRRCIITDGYPGDGSSSSSYCGGDDFANEGAGAKFACVKVVGTIDANARDVYKLFLDNERVQVSQATERGTDSDRGICC